MDAAALLEILKWSFVAIVAPVLGWFGGLLALRRTAKRRKKTRIKFLRGLPPEAKAILVDFYQDGTHTQRGNPSLPAVALMLEQKVLKVGPGGGTYDAIDRYLSIDPELWEVMDDWASADPAVFDHIYEPVEQRAG